MKLQQEHPHKTGTPILSLWIIMRSSAVYPALSFIIPNAGHAEVRREGRASCVLLTRAYIYDAAGSFNQLSRAIEKRKKDIKKGHLA